MKARLQKILSEFGVASRRRAEDIIGQGRVKVNGRVAVVGDKADADTDIIECDGTILCHKGKKIYIMLYKPRGYVTTMSDEKGRKTVSELTVDCNERVYPVGRLDMNSEGLLIMTNDGELAQKLTHPSNEVAKTYYVWVVGEDFEKLIVKRVEGLSREMTVDDYMVKAKSVKVVELDKDYGVLEITIGEGRNRQIRKMCANVGLKVTRLKRVSEGNLYLGGLTYGHWRYMTEKEIDYLKSL